MCPQKLNTVSQTYKAFGIFASHTPLQRAEKYGDREYVTQEENEENRKQSIGSFEARAESHFDGVGGYNSFWV